MLSGNARAIMLLWCALGLRADSMLSIRKAHWLDGGKAAVVKKHKVKAMLNRTVSTTCFCSSGVNNMSPACELKFPAEFTEKMLLDALDALGDEYSLHSARRTLALSIEHQNASKVQQKLERRWNVAGSSNAKPKSEINGQDPKSAARHRAALNTQ